jgi:hypothetical protein
MHDGLLAILNWTANVYAVTKKKLILIFRKHFISQNIIKDIRKRMQKSFRCYLTKI